MSESHRIDVDDFMRMFNTSQESLPASFLVSVQEKQPDMPFAQLVAETDTTWRYPGQHEIEEFVLDMLTRIDGVSGPRPVDENKAAFETGWSENLVELLGKEVSLSSLKPRYFRGTKYLRYAKTLIVSDNHDLQHDLFVIATQIIFRKFLREFPVIYEFGCGSCANLLALARMFPDKELVGLDWAQASVDIAELLRDKAGVRVRSQLFDMMHPAKSFSMAPGSAVLTVHALEQLGTRFQSWLDFLLEARPAIVVNYEPIDEFYDPENLWDYLALKYSRKRGYLSGYLTSLQRLADAGRIEILEAIRPYLGGVYHEASLIAWKVI